MLQRVLSYSISIAGYWHKVQNYAIHYLIGRNRFGCYDCLIQVVLGHISQQGFQLSYMLYIAVAPFDFNTPHWLLLCHINTDNVNLTLQPEKKSSYLCAKYIDKYPTIS